MQKVTDGSVIEVYTEEGVSPEQEYFNFCFFIFIFFFLDVVFIIMAILEKNLNRSVGHKKQVIKILEESESLVLMV